MRGIDRYCWTDGQNEIDKERGQRAPAPLADGSWWHAETGPTGWQRETRLRTAFHRDKVGYTTGEGVSWKYNTDNVGTYEAVLSLEGLSDHGRR